MIERFLKLCSLALALSLPLGAQDAPMPSAHPSDTPLLLEDVLKVSYRHAPAIMEERANVLKADGVILEAEGAFDLNLSGELRSRVTGTWSGSYLAADAKQYLTQDGIQVYGGYRVSDGRFPIYEDQFFTNELGEFKVGVLLPLMRDRAFDKNRFGVADAGLQRDQVKTNLLLKMMNVQRSAITAYWNWVAAGHQLIIYENLLKIAKDREKGLIRQTEEGAVAEIALIENQQNITRRENLMVSAMQRFETAANQLSFYLRDSNGMPLHPERDSLPGIDVVVPNTDKARVAVGPAQQNLTERPEVEFIRLAMDRAKQKLRLGENNLKPQLSLGTELSRDFGRIGAGGSSRDSTDTIVSVRFSMPLGLRAARGQISQSRAELKRLELRQQRMLEQLSIQLNNVALSVDMALRGVALTVENVEQSIQLLRAERIRFQNGASDFFLLILREEAEANARISKLQAALSYHTAVADLHAVTMDFESLGIEQAAVDAAY